MGRHPRATPASAQFWTELVLSTALMGAVFALDVETFRAVSWDWNVSALLAVHYVGLIFCGLAMQWVITIALVRAFTGMVAGMWQRATDLTRRVRHRNDPPVTGYDDGSAYAPVQLPARFHTVCIDCDGLAGPGVAATDGGCVCPGGAVTTRRELDLDTTPR